MPAGWPVLSPRFLPKKALWQRGIEILACGTCLGYYGLKETEEVERVSKTYDTAEAFSHTDEIIAL